ncbi:polyphenol oxidase family protein [Gracilinema caldarium]|uniref:Multi-copper polyphenol oxidoreductase, laccase n=1 Tax=Gracilinema caldarium (strain ATCC 51460 / DSM 7334 / H1) TaxID=744872 RepID=F8F070_GRAC1|nr:polyphenol oxidase family protein [Gracilinema caldarium]AEJ18934.1 Multi-copper polyphenol oxidoreductase, laccase [Gracilinema caldarium DSM 7334]
MNIYPFNLVLDPVLNGFVFTFIADGNPVSDPACFLSTVDAGDMKFIPGSKNPNRLRFFTALAKRQDMEKLPVYAVEQIHSRDVVLVKDGSPYDVLQADGLATTLAEAWLSITVADCLPIFLRDRSGTCRAVLHSGWKGTGIVEKALSIFIDEWRIHPRDILAVLGPCICRDCYQVDSERAHNFEIEFGKSPGPYPLGPVVQMRQTQISGVTYYLDLQAANAHLLAKAGVEELAICQNCTVTDPRLGSFRRQGAASYTRMVALIN